jgi:hypothetical protein
LTRSDVAHAEIDALKLGQNLKDWVLSSTVSDVFEGARGEISVVKVVN